MDEAHIDTYLKRLQREREPPSLNYLSKLQEAHMLCIPFENLDVMNKKHIHLAPENLYTKILLNKRGGFCFELNGLFYDLLYSLGFQVYMIEAAVYNKKIGTFGYMRNHMALIVTINNEKYLVDVGYGDSFRKPLSLKEKETEDISGRYRLTHVEANHYRVNIPGPLNETFKYWILEQQIHDLWSPQYKFHVDRKLTLSDFQDMCNWMESSPESGFTKGRTWTIARPDGRISLSENGVTITKYLTKYTAKYTGDKDFEYYIRWYINEPLIT